MAESFLIGPDFMNLVFRGLAEAFGAKGLKIESPDEISSTLKKALIMQGPGLGQGYGSFFDSVIGQQVRAFRRGRNP